MRKIGLVAVVLLPLLAMLTGCGLLGEPARLPMAVLTVSTYADTLKVICDASNSRGRNLTFNWDFDDGTIVLDGGASVSHVYAAPGVYNIRVTVVETRGRVERFDTAAQTVNLTDPSQLPHAVILTFRGSSGDETDAFYSWERVSFVGTASFDPLGSPLTYWWEIRPVDDLGNPISDPQWTTTPIVDNRASFKILLPGPLCGPPVIVRRVKVTLTVWNNRNQSDTAVKYITVTGG